MEKQHTPTPRASLARRLVAVPAAAAATVLSTPLFAQSTTIPLDVTDATAQLGEVNSSMIAIGAVLFGLAAVAMGIRWVKATFFG